jgi:hypothetical protein
VAATTPAPPKHGLRAIDPAPFRLRAEGFDRADGQAVGLEGVLADLDRRIRPFGRGFGAPWAARRAQGMTGGFQWDAKDSRTGAWYPQGVSASPDGAVVFVSWYRNDDRSHARVSCVDVAAGRYRHLLLTTATGEPLRSHAGGLAWREHLLYVTDTKTGLRVFDLARIVRTDAKGDDRYALPEAGRYRSAGGGLRFSFASVDESANSLLVGEYVDEKPGARLVRWPFAPGGRLAQEPASDAWVTAHSNLQGAVVLGDRIALAQSRGARLPGVLHASPFAETVQQRRWAVGGEDLAVTGGELLSLSEHPDFPWPLPRRRTVFRARAR